MLILVVGCGARGSGSGSASGSGSGSASGTGSASDAAVVAQVAWPDAGSPADPVVYADAGLMELGSSQCEMVISRLIACPGVGAEHKKDLSKKQQEIRAMAADPAQRENVAALCRELGAAMEETFRRLSC